MAVKIRLQRHGRKGRPIFTIVSADERSKRDGRYIEKLGQYNPNTNPATVDLNFDRALYWYSVGAVPTDSARSILSSEGVLMKDHLLRGVKKGALTEEQAEAKFAKWQEERAKKVEAKAAGLAKQEADASKARLAEETKIKEERAAAMLAKQSELTAAAEAEAAAAAAAEAPAAEVEAPAAEAEASAAEAEAPAAEAEAPAAEAEAPAAEAEAPAAEAAAEAPAAEAEAPAVEAEAPAAEDKKEEA